MTLSYLSKCPLVVVSGTGTDVGKTHASRAILGALAADGIAVAAEKLVETGVPEGDDEGKDSAALASSATFHVKPRSPSPGPRPLRFRAALGPPQAARLEGRAIPIAGLRERIATLRAGAPALLVEGAGGLFSPLTETTTFADFLHDAASDAALVLVASDRLGVQHDVLATVRAARTLRLAPCLIVLSAPPTPDASTGTNEAELLRHLETSGSPRLVTLPWDDVENLAVYPPLVHAVRAVLAPKLTRR